LVKRKPKPTRVPDFTKEQVSRALIKCAGIRADASKKLKVTRQCISQYIARYELEPLLAEIIETNLDKCESVMQRAINFGEAWAVEKYLSSKGASRGYGRNINLITDQKPQVFINFNIIAADQITLDPSAQTKLAMVPVEIPPPADPTPPAPKV
jgi:hypothetical protein